MHASAPADLIQHRVDDRGDAGCVAYITVNNAAKRNTLGMPGKRAIASCTRRFSDSCWLLAG